LRRSGTSRIPQNPANAGFCVDNLFDFNIPSFLFIKKDGIILPLC
ncbi:MAG: hypothetical protein UR53_C0001G0001, partial [Candidatus Magasanikbacteria bacterium GW2011_GWC2_34_16]